jgi:hypothetical protein
LKDKYALILLSILFLLVAIPRLKYPDFDHGDEFSDADIMLSGENFLKFGFVKMHFLPIFDVASDIDNPRDFYTHYPPLHSLINGWLRIIFKTDSLYFFRAVALFFSWLNVLFWYLIIKRITHSSFLGVLCTLFYLTNPLFIYSFDGLHQLAYSDALRSIILFLFLRLALPSLGSTKRKVLLPALMLLIFIESWMTFEYIFYLSIFFVLFKYFFRSSSKELSGKVIFLLLLAPVIGFLLHYLQNAWHFGSFSLAFQDLRKIAVERITSSKDSAIANLNLFVWLKYVILGNFAKVFLFGYYILIPFALFSYFIYYQLGLVSKEKIKPLFKLCVLLAISGFSWYIAFPSHSLAHVFVTFLARHLLPLAACVFALVCYIIFLFSKEKTQNRFFPQVPLLFLIVILVRTGIVASDLPVTAENIARAKDFIIFKQCLSGLRSVSNESDEVGVNFYRRPFIRFYVHRKTPIIFDKATLEASLLPRYFVFFPYNEGRSKELFDVLTQHYTVISECKSFRFPSIIFALKK